MKHSELVIQTVLESWKSGLTGSTIARKIGATRNVVMGILHRARRDGLIDYRTDFSRKHAQKVSLSKKPRTICHSSQLEPEEPEERIEAVDTEIVSTIGRVSIFDLTQTSCRWITCEDPWLFCGQTKKTNSSYCEEHHHIVWKPRKKKEEPTRFDLKQWSRAKAQQKEHI